MRRLVAAGLVGLPAMAFAQTSGYAPAFQPPPAYQTPPPVRPPPAWRTHSAYRGLPAWQAQPALRVRPVPPIAPGNPQPQASPAIGEQVVAPDGRVAYAIRTERGNPDELRSRSILALYNRGASSRLLVAPRPSSDPRQNLTGFYHLVLGPDGRTLYFETLAWQAIGAVHALALDRGQIRFIAPGRLACVIPGGQWQGYLLVQQRRPMVFGGSFDGFWLYDVNGREIGPAALGADSSRYCQGATS